MCKLFVGVLYRAVLVVNDGIWVGGLSSCLVFQLCVEAERRHVC